MKQTGYRALSSWIWNYRRQIRANDGKLMLCGNAVLDLAKSSQIALSDDLIIGANLRRGSHAETYVKLRDNAKFEIQGRFQLFFGASVELTQNAMLTVGNGYINTGASIMCTKSISIGDEVFIARNVYITDSDHHTLFDETDKIRNEPQPICIGNHVLICFGAVILKGVTIGDGAVIGAGSVVTRDIPAGCLAAGSPARVVKENIKWK